MQTKYKVGSKAIWYRTHNGTSYAKIACRIAREPLNYQERVQIEYENQHGVTIKKTVMKENVEIQRSE